MKFKDFFKILFIALFACVALTACGGNDDEPDDPNKGSGSDVNVETSMELGKEFSKDILVLVMNSLLSFSADLEMKDQFGYGGLTISIWDNTILRETISSRGIS